MHIAKRAAVFTRIQQQQYYQRSSSLSSSWTPGFYSKRRKCNEHVGCMLLMRPFRDVWAWFRAQRFVCKCLTVGTGSILSFGGYIALCLFVQWKQEEMVEMLFQPQEEYSLEEWSQVEPTLREGDIVLMMGTGVTSWKITLAQFAYSFMCPAALRYSHVGVVVEPAQLERWPSRLTTSASTIAPMDVSDSNRTLTSPSTIADKLINERLMLQRRKKRGAIIMEAVDNLDVNAPDINGKVRHECVQLVEANCRLFGRDADRWCYSRFAVRRLKGFEWTSQRKRLLRNFINENVGRPLDKSPLLLLSFIHPKLYEWTGARSTGTEISCGELIVELYKYCGVIQGVVGSGPSVDGVSNADTDAAVNPDGSCSRSHCQFSRPSIQTAPFHFTEGSEVGVLDFAEGISLGPEVRMSLPGGTKEPQQ